VQKRTTGAEDRARSRKIQAAVSAEGKNYCGSLIAKVLKVREGQFWSQKRWSGRRVECRHLHLQACGEAFDAMDDLEIIEPLAVRLKRSLRKLLSSS